MVECLQSCRLFGEMTTEQIRQLLEKYPNAVHSYGKKSYIFRQEDTPEKLYILIKGSVAIAQETVMGRKRSIANVTDIGELFGEVYLFIRKDRYDMYARALEDTVVLEFSKTLFLQEKADSFPWENQLRYNLLCIFAEKAYQLNQKMRVLGSGSIREKIVQFLLSCQDQKGRIPTTFSREAMADYMNVARPSLSRELGKMQFEGILRFEGKEIIITDQEKFESYI